MNRLYLNLIWYGYWRWRKPQTGMESRRKIYVACCRKRPYSIDQLLRASK